ncbi:hypothetical protein BHE74_00024527 [Ensete ventricosum]|nr:hypothetical protein BHE74_00024527 [Ensete ventricosum]RZS01484.1 hypothetical protein BHM03_00031339 [Ensete ventricosum]
MLMFCFSCRVPLSNGGYLVIEQTEALVSIDVNGGQCMLGEGTSQEKAVLDVNLAAVKQVYCKGATSKGYWWHHCGRFY